MLSIVLPFLSPVSVECWVCFGSCLCAPRGNCCVLSMSAAGAFGRAIPRIAVGIQPSDSPLARSILIARELACAQKRPTQTGDRLCASGRPPLSGALLFIAPVCPLEAALAQWAWGKAQKRSLHREQSAKKREKWRAFVRAGVPLTRSPLCAFLALTLASAPGQGLHKQGVGAETVRGKLRGGSKLCQLAHGRAGRSGGGAQLRGFGAQAGPMEFTPIETPTIYPHWIGQTTSLEPAEPETRPDRRTAG